MDQMTTQTAAPAPAETASSQPTENVDAYLDKVFGSSSGSTQPTTAPVVSTPVSPQPTAPAHAAPAIGNPMVAPVAPVQTVNGQPAAAPPENPLPAGVRQRLSELNQRAQQAEAERQHMVQQMAEMRGYMLAQQQQAQGQQQQQVPDHISDPQGYAAWVRDQTLAEVRHMTQQQQQQAAQEAAKREAAISRQTSLSISKSSEALAFQGLVGSGMPPDQAKKLISEATHAAVNSGLGNQFMATGDPVNESIRWYRTQQLAKQIPNGDLNSYVEAEVQRRMSQPQALNQQAAQYASQQRQAYPASPQPLSALPTGGSQAETIPADPNDSLRMMFDRQRREKIERAMSMRGR
jgi:hypothetical protein